ncbi:MAG: ABC transporter substrate-binding protein, partial [Bacteroidales bacterium]|nr:ABC transporter substrate-binding protein [Bacteroidales bacterium]
MNKWIVICLALFLSSCKLNETDASDQLKTASGLVNSFPNHARWFKVITHDNFDHLQLINPWDSSKLLSEFVLVKSDQTILPEQFKEIKKIKVPIQSMACLSGSHFIVAEKLGVFDKITAVGEAQHIGNSNIQNGLQTGEIVSIKFNEQIDPEKALMVNPDIIFTSPYQNSDYSDLEQYGLTVVPFTDYMEQDPVGRAEWIRFMALFFEKEKQADSIVNAINSEYNRIKNRLIHTNDKPTIYANKPFRGIWYMPGGNSYVARIFKDAGASYLWKDDSLSGSLAIDFEVVYNKASEADFWRLFITRPGPYSYDDLLAEDERFGDFAAFKNKKIIICKTVESEYFEKAGMEPELILADLAHIFHPDQF